MERIYTMPQEFMQDSSVPARWKIFGILNGFWVSGKTFYGTNEWLEKQSGYESRNVRKALAELEELGLITRNVRGFERIILPGRLEGGGTQRASGGGTQRAAEEAPSVPDIADSNADRESSAKVFAPELQPLVVVEESDPDRPSVKKKKATPAWSCFLAARALLSKEAGFEIQTGAWDLKSVEKGITFLGGSKHVLTLVQDLIDSGQAHKAGYSISRLLSSGNLNRFKSENL